MSTDLSNDYAEINNKIDALNTYKDVAQDSKTLQKNKGNSLEGLLSETSTQLGAIKDQQKRFQRNAPTSMDQLLNLIGKTKGNSSSTLNYLRKKVLDAMVAIEPKATEILITEAIKTVGCSQDQTYDGITLPQFNQIPYIQSLPVTQGIYIPVNNIDFLGNLKIEQNSKIGKMFYEKPEPSVSENFVPYGGRTKYPFNKLLNLSMDSNFANRTYSSIYSNFYNGSSLDKILDISYTTQNDLGVSGDFFRVFLLNKNNTQGSNLNVSRTSVKQFLKDYFSTIRIVDPVNVVATTMNYISGFVSYSGPFNYKKLSDETKYERLLQRILGLCNDSRKEIDVSGVAKIPELDGVDESFFEFTEQDLRFIETKINNIQNGVVQFESCGEVKLPVNSQDLLDGLVDLRDNLSGNTPQQTVQSIENIVDTFINNPEWGPLVPIGINLDIQINKDFIKNLPLAIASGILTPKVLLPIMVMVQAIEKSAVNKVNNQILTSNSLIQSGNTQLDQLNAGLQSGTTFGQTVDNIIDDAVDFIKKYKTFVFETIQKINAEFIRVLFEILKKDILNLLNVLITDIQKSAALKKYAIIIRILQLILIVRQLVSDYRKCKSLVDDILNLLNFINTTFNGGSTKIPLLLLPFTQLLGGTSPERSLLNTLEELQKRGLPTGAMPDGSPNLMNQLLDSVIKGLEKEETENGTISAGVVVPPLTGGVLQVFGKKL